MLGRLGIAAAAMLAVAGCATVPEQRDNRDLLFVWAADADGQSGDFLAVIDAAPTSPTYGEVMTTLPTGGTTAGAHHSEHEMPADGMLFANDFAAGRTFIFDLRNPLAPRLAGSFEAAGDYMHPHSFVRLPNGNVLATFQMRGHGNSEPGGLAELTPAGRVVRLSASAADPRVDHFVRPYSLQVLPEIDRVVTTDTDMHDSQVTRAVQVWRLSDLSLIKTILLPPGRTGRENEYPAEPRLLSDGRTVLVNTFTCGLYRINDLTGEDPGAEWIYSMAGAGMPDIDCALPVIVGRFWVQTDYSLPGLVTLDMTNPGRPVEVSRLTMPPDQRVHWISLAPDGRRIVMTGYRALQHRLLLARIDPRTGALELDTTFRSAGATVPGVDFNRANWPHGATGPARPHGAVFSRSGIRWGFGDSAFICSNSARPDALARDNAGARRLRNAASRSAVVARAEYRPSAAPGCRRRGVHGRLRPSAARRRSGRAGRPLRSGRHDPGPRRPSY
ncbi:MAG: hypothetical protein ACT4OE_08815 [Sphingosinicella sp.]